jgi:hypothetical protein
MISTEMAVARWRVEKSGVGQGGLLRVTVQRASERFAKARICRPSGTSGGMTV